MCDDAASGVNVCDTTGDMKVNDDAASAVKECDANSDTKMSDDAARGVNEFNSSMDVKMSDATSEVKMSDDPSFCLQDGTLFQHTVSDASRPGDHANPCGLSINSRGDVSHTSRYAHLCYCYRNEQAARWFY